jgi:putative membrane-bound dehydrogenase-like protein
MRTAVASLAGLLLAVGVTAAPPPADFAQPQSAAKPAPFPVTFIDQGKYDPRLKGYVTPDGFRLDIVAADPVVVNPVGLTFAPDGRLFVLEWAPDPYSDGKWFEFKETFRYRDGSSKQVATMKKFVGDPLKEMTYDPKTGRFIAGKVIVMDELPSTVLYHDGWVYLTGRGTVRRYRQSRPGGLWDIKETIAQGFCGFHHHQVSGLTLGNDGLLYITSGDDDNFVEGSDGSRATVLRTGAVFRCRPDGSGMETYSLGYRNPYRDLAHDEAFNWFHTDNDNEDGSKFTGCRIMHVAEGTDYGWRLATGARCCRPDALRGAVAGELPGKVPPMVKTGRGSPAGLLIYNDTRLPKQYRGLLSYPDVYRKVIRSYAVRPAGSSFEITGEFELVKSDDPLFRPCQMVTGPDGAIYICDWRTDSGGAGKLWGDGQHGRIYRLRWVGTKDQPEIPLRGMDSWAKLLAASDDELVAKLGADDFTDRLVARNELVRRGERSRQRVLRRIVSGTLPSAGRLPALGVLQAHWNADVEDLFRLLLNDQSADIRRTAVEGLALHATPKDARTHDHLVRAMGDEHPAVRRVAALAVGRVGAPEAADALVKAWAADDGKDVFLSDALVRGVERLGTDGVAALLKAADAGDARLRDRVALAFTAFRTRPAFDALPKLIASANYTPGQRADLVRSYANYLFDPPVSFDPLADLLAGRPNEAAAVKVAGLEVLAAAGGLAGPAGNRFAIAQLDSPDAEVRLAAIQAAETARLTAAVPKLAQTLADAKRPAAERAAALRAVRVAGDRSAVGPALAVLGSNDTAPLRVEALRTIAALDPVAARPAAEKLLDQPDVTLQTEAVAVLGATKDGARLVGERLLARKLSRDLQPRVMDALRKFATDPAVMKLSVEVMKGRFLLTLAPADVVKVTADVSAKGDAKRGKELYLNSKALGCVTCHKLEGVGGSVGPDLTRVWDTHSVEKLMESIIQPSKEIKEGYQAYRLSTAGGQVYTGLKVSETKTEVVLRDATGKDVRVARDDVDELVPSKVSLMPDDAVAQISYDQFVDLLAFLRSRPEQESLRTRTATSK